MTVDALGGDPGVDSALYAGTHGDDAANNRKLLTALENVPEERRGAAFVCVLALADPTGTIVLGGGVALSALIAPLVFAEGVTVRRAIGVALGVAAMAVLSTGEP